MTVPHVDKPAFNRGYDAYAAELVLRTIRGVDAGEIPRAQYGAVMVDEGHHFQPEWFKLVVQMVDPESDSMLVLYDDAQSIYGRKQRRALSFASVGIQARGRTTILRLNYRNTLEVLAVAKAFAEELLAAENADDDGVPIIAPESAGRRGPIPELIACKNEHDEADLIAARIEDECAQGRPASDVAVLYRRNRHAAVIHEALGRRGIRNRRAQSQYDKRTLFEGGSSVKLLTLQSRKGLEFGATFIPRICEMPQSDADVSEEARLLYVEMTRATERLVLTHVGNSAFCERLQAAIGNLQVSLRAA